MQLAKEAGITRNDLNRALSLTGNPSSEMVQKVVKAFGLKLEVAIVDPFYHAHSDKIEDYLQLLRRR